MQDKDKCPVCDMDTSTSALTMKHRGAPYKFCSHQCMENFIARPQLYLRLKSPKQEGKHVIKQRSFTLDTPIPELGLEALRNDLLKMMGIRDVQVTNSKVSVIYDLLEATALQIEQFFEQEGAKLGSGWADRLKRGWIHYTEENELNTLSSDDSACCNKPPRRG